MFVLYSGRCDSRQSMEYLNFSVLVSVLLRQGQSLMMSRDNQATDFSSGLLSLKQRISSILHILRLLTFLCLL